MSTQLHNGDLKARGRSLRMKPSLQHLDLGLTSLQKCEKSKFLLFKLPERERESHSVVSDSLQPDGLYSTWNSPGQNTGVGRLCLLQGIFPTQGWNLGLPRYKVDSLPTEPPGKTIYISTSQILNEDVKELVKSPPAMQET